MTHTHTHFSPQAPLLAEEYRGRGLATTGTVLTIHNIAFQGEAWIRSLAMFQTPLLLVCLAVVVGVWCCGWWRGAAPPPPPIPTTTSHRPRSPTTRPSPNEQAGRRPTTWTNWGCPGTGCTTPGRCWTTRGPGSAQARPTSTSCGEPSRTPTSACLFVHACGSGCSRVRPGSCCACMLIMDGHVCRPYVAFLKRLLSDNPLHLCTVTLRRLQPCTPLGQGDNGVAHIRARGL